MSALKLNLHFTEKGWTVSDTKGEDRTEDIMILIDKLEERWNRRLQVKARAIRSLQDELGLSEIKRFKLEQDLAEGGSDEQ